MLDNDKKYYFTVQIMALLFFVSLGIISWIFFKERMLGFDPAYFSFAMIETGDFAIACNRWGLAITQIIPLLALKFHCSLPTFLKLYSVSFIAVNYALFLVCSLLLKNYKAALALLLTLCLAFRWVFYYPTSELFMGMSFTILLWAVISPSNPYTSKRKQWAATLLSLPLFVVISYCQQLACFAALFIIALEISSRRKWKNWHLWGVLLCSMVWFYLRMKFFSNSSYEQARLEGQNDLLQYLPNFFSLSGWVYAKAFFLSSLKSLCVTFLICLVLLALWRQWLLLAFFTLSISGYLIFLILISAQGVDELFFQYYATLFGLFVGVMLVYLLQKKTFRFILLTLTALLLFNNVKGIYKARKIQTERMNYLERLTDYGRTFPNRKFIISTRNIPNNVVFYHQFVPFETMLNSSLPSPDSAMTFYPADNMNEFDSLLHQKDLFLTTPWDPLHYKSTTINRNYYRLTATEYIKLNTSQKDSSFDERAFNNNNIRIHVLAEEIHSDAYNFVVVPLQITNTSGHVLNSIPDAEHPIFVSYHLYDNDGKLIAWDNTRTPLEVDIASSYKQGLTVYLPKEKGHYIIEADIVTDGLRWWNANARFQLVVD